MAEELYKKQQKKKKISIVLVIISVFVEIIACLLWLAPIAGFIIYPLVSGFAVVLNIISFILARDSKTIRIINCVISIILVLTIITDVIYFIKFVLGFQ